MILFRYSNKNILDLDFIGNPIPLIDLNALPRIEKSTTYEVSGKKYFFESTKEGGLGAVDRV